MTYDNPLKWLLAELPGYIDPAQLAELMRRYTVNKQAYEREVKIRHMERVIATTERFATSADRDARLKRWRDRLAQLQSEQI